MNLEQVHTLSLLLILCLVRLISASRDVLKTVFSSSAFLVELKKKLPFYDGDWDFFFKVYFTVLFSMVSCVNIAIV